MPQLNTNSSPADNIKARLSNLKVEEVEALQTILHRRLLKNWLRRNGRLNVFLGGLTIWLGLSPSPESSILKTIQTLIGFLILGQSLWAIASPSVPALLRFAGMFLVAAIWNTFIVLRGSIIGGAFPFLVGLLAAAQFWWAYQMYKGYRRYRQMDLSEPPSNIAQFYDEVSQAIANGVLKNDPAQFRLWIGLNRWQGLLLEDRVVFVYKWILIIQSKEEANFTPNSSRAWAKRRVYGRIKLDTVFVRALMQRDSYRKYARWKGEEALLAETPSLWQRLPQIARIILVVIAGLLLTYITFMIIGMIKLFIQYG